MNNDTGQPAEATSSEAARPSIAGIAAKTQPKDVLDGLIRDLNNLILIMISAVYYFDCFSLLFLLRYVGQVQSTSGGMRIVLSTNVICILTHVFHSLPQPAPREFWNHGGMLVDFVGEKPPTRFKLLVFDLLIVALQILHLALYYKKATTDGASGQPAQAPAQDLEAEEAGISRAVPPAQIESEEGIEMQSLLSQSLRSTGGAGPPDEAQDRTILLRKDDFREVFINTAHNTGSSESDAVLRRLIARVNAVRARTAAQQAVESSN